LIIWFYDDFVNKHIYKNIFIKPADKFTDYRECNPIFVGFYIVDLQTYNINRMIIPGMDRMLS